MIIKDTVFYIKDEFLDKKLQKTQINNQKTAFFFIICAYV